MSAHRAPEDIRKHLDHPVVDGDGHWVEYAPVFAEHIRKVQHEEPRRRIQPAKVSGPARACLVFWFPPR
jgi:hypothetical protein